MDVAMDASREEAEEIARKERHYKRMHLNNLISRAEQPPKMEMDLGLYVAWAHVAYKTNGLTKMSRHRMSKELAQELKAQIGDGAYLYCVERLSNNTDHPQLWRDVLAWLDEGVDDGTDEVASDKPRPQAESDDYEPSGS